jgi:hypothetical protein
LLPRAILGLRVGYGYQFARAIVPERSDLNQLRMDLGGHSVSNGQIAGAALGEHIGILHGLAHADLFTERLSFEVEGGIDPIVKFPLARSAAVCSVLTGCVEPASVDNPQRLTVTTYLDVYFDALFLDGALRASLGYENITAQLRPDGERRSALYSPDAKFYVKLEIRPDLFYERARGSGTARARSEELAGAEKSHF